MIVRYPGFALALALACSSAAAFAQTAPTQTSNPPPPLWLLRSETSPPSSLPPVTTSSTESPRGFRSLATCPTCPVADGRAPSSDGTDPWRIGAFYTAGDPLSHVTFGVVGQRNERTPLFMSVPIGTAIGPAPPRSNANATPDTRTHWLATIAVDKTLFEGRNGGSLGVLGEAFLPLGTFRTKSRTSDLPSPSGGALRGAMRVRF